MPTYIFENIRTHDQFEIFMSIPEREVYLKEHPHVKQILTATAIVSGIAGLRRVDGGFRDRLKEIKSKHPRSNINTDN